MIEFLGSKQAALWPCWAQALWEYWMRVASILDILPNWWSI